MASLSGRIKVSVFGFVALWIFARSVFAAEMMPVRPLGARPPVAPSAHSFQALR